MKNKVLFFFLISAASISFAQSQNKCNVLKNYLKDNWQYDKGKKCYLMKSCFFQLYNTDSLCIKSCLNSLNKKGVIKKIGYPTNYKNDTFVYCVQSSCCSQFEIYFINKKAHLGVVSMPNRIINEGMLPKRE